MRGNAANAKSWMVKIHLETKLGGINITCETATASVPASRGKLVSLNQKNITEYWGEARRELQGRQGVRERGSD